ncbi:MAG: hydantoinase/oxoprolinase family protein, partial [Gammaproteobacteria bacterium]|nr:hydantoinase/oxoprolinase family protein [Gammaproteobacteria bacterium]
DNVTVTDSDLTLGRLEAEGFADGSMKLNSEASKQAIQHNLSEPLEMDVALAAFGVAEIVEEDMANAAREHATESGKSLTDRTLIAFGGAAPIHALPLASKLGIDRVIIPDSAGVGSAVGFLLAPVAFELSRSCRVRLSQFQVKDLNDLLQEMSTYTHGVVESGAPDHDRSEIRQAQMRYVGQGYNIPVDIPIRALEQNDATFIEEAFNNTYINLYKKLHEGVDIEIVGLTVSVSAFLVSADAVESTAPGELDQAEIDHKTLMFNAQAGDYQQVNVYSRAKLQAGNQLSGPGLVRDLGTTVMVPDGYVVTVATDNSLIIERQSST